MVQSKRTSGIGFILRKYFLSAFVAFSFVAYAIHERTQTSSALANVVTPTLLVPTNPATAPLVPTPTTPITSAAGNGKPPATNTPVDVQPTAAPPTDVPPTTVPPTDVPATAVSSLYRDGTYTGDVADAFYGNVQVQATIQGGKITQVKFLDYPHDRRTSQYINSQAVPWLQSEAIQAQSANVDLISGATLTSRAFVESFQAALTKAHK
jgi:uncharacterized protein with FMN-binding domain